MEEKEKAGIIKRILGKRKLWLVVLVFAFAFGIFRYFSARNDSTETVEVKKGTVTEELVLSGEIGADEYVKLSFPTYGQIAWVGVSEGQVVKKGQALTRLDTTVLNTAFQQARATLRAAEVAVENVHDQLKDHDADETYAQKDTRTAAEAAKDKAWEAYVAAEYNLRNASLVAPFEGLITYLAHSVSGVNVSLGEIQVEIINPGSIYFLVSADQMDVTEIHVGQEVEVVLDPYPDDTFKGEVSFVSYTPKSGEIGSVYKVRVEFEREMKDTGKFKIGMTGDVRLTVNEKEDVLYVPPRFVKTDIKGKYVNRGKGKKVYVEVGLEGEDRVEIKSEEISEGDTLYD